MLKQPGWLYVGDGWLRYRDADGWTDHYLPAESVRGLEWPPAAPEADVSATPLSDAGEPDGQSEPTARVRAARVRGLLRARERHTGRHRASA